MDHRRDQRTIFDEFSRHRRQRIPSEVWRLRQDGTGELQVVSRPNRHRAELPEVTLAIECVQRLLSPPFMSARETLPDSADADRAIENAWNAIDTAFSTTSDPPARLVELAVRLRRADDVIRQMKTKKLTDTLELVREALARFDGIKSLSQLIAECPRGICQLGFDRGMLSLVENSLWRPVSAYSEHEPEWAQQLVASGQEFPQEFSASLPEFTLIRRARSIRVTDVQRNPEIYQRVVGASQSRSYVAAGVMSNGVLTGLLHADRYFQHSDVDDGDRSLLGLFAEAFGHIMAKAVLIERSSALTLRLATLTAEINSAATGLAGSEGGGGLLRPESGGTLMATHSPASEPAHSLDRHGLTQRELQVLQLMAKGANNIEIATRLFISTGTVKSHVKHILRKLGAANRAEAVSRWFGSQQTHGVR
jgi:DNA-binding CsgD family transcriptional regulator/GAF domain-containing protein